MFSTPLLLLPVQMLAALAAPPLLETINPTLVASSVNIGASPLNSTALREASAQALSLAGAHSIPPPHVSVLSPPRHAVTIKIILVPSVMLMSTAETQP